MGTRVQIQVRGLVQGVGFRPFVFSLAERLALRGRVFNNGAGVLIDVEGDGRAVERFIAEVESNPPALSVIESVERLDDLEPANYRDFRIIESASSGENFAHVPADVATCDDCLRELFDPHDRRYRYPFINCANCGPRFTIIEDIPYDRAKTTMREFAMCQDCRVEYENPLDRRFHAEPIACPHCGPRLFLALARGRERALDPVDGEDVIYQASLLLSEGGIIAVKGVGGFRLAFDALNAEAVERLRRRKYREDKPFAMMAGSVEVIKQYCAVSETEEGQAAVELEAIADRSLTQGYEFEVTSAGVIKAERVILRVAEDLLADVSPHAVSARFHLGVAGLIASIALRLRVERRLNRVVLSGGVFQNMYLLAEVCRSLESNGFDVFTHRRTPANDGGVSLGQAAVANARLVAGRV